MAFKELAAKFICRIIRIGDSVSYVSSRRLRHIQGLHAYHVEIGHVLRVCFLSFFGEWVSTVCKKIWQFHVRRQQTANKMGLRVSDNVRHTLRTALGHQTAEACQTSVCDTNTPSAQSLQLFGLRITHTTCKKTCLGSSAAIHTSSQSCYNDSRKNLCD